MIAEEIGRGMEQSKGRGERKEERKKERSVITARCAVSIRSVTTLLLILNTELFSGD